MVDIGYQCYRIQWQALFGQNPSGIRGSGGSAHIFRIFHSFSVHFHDLKW